ncbi:hypothetical protein D3C73_1336810 [compost metagenome]
MLGNGIAEGEWEMFAGTFGVTSHPFPATEIEDLLRQAGFGKITRFFGSYLIDGWMAVKEPDEQL